MKKTALVVLTAILALFLWGCQMACGTCNGEETVACAACQGSGSVDCPEPECEGGTTGASCTNCFGREGMRTCSTCEGEGTVFGPCSKCEGSGKIVNPLTWEAFECIACDGAGVADEDCDKCGGYGVTCNYCEANRSSYPTADWHPYYRECATCQGVGSFACDECAGIGSFPCPDCREEDYNAVISSVEQKKAEGATEANQQALIEEAKTLLSGIEEGEPSYYADQLSQELLKQAEDMLVSYEGEFAEKDELLDGITTIRPYCDTRWRCVEGDPAFFGSTANPPNGYLMKATYNRDNFYIRVQDLIFYPCDCGDCDFTYEWGGTNESYKVFVQEDGSLVFNQYEKPTHGAATDTVINSSTLKRQD